MGVRAYIQYKYYKQHTKYLPLQILPYIFGVWDSTVAQFREVNPDKLDPNEYKYL